jgi:hypothetical protein
MGFLRPRVAILKKIQNNFRTMVITHLVPFEFTYFQEIFYGRNRTGGSYLK